MSNADRIRVRLILAQNGQERWKTVSDSRAARLPQPRIRAKFVQDRTIAAR
jgi:hypothetical protein